MSENSNKDTVFWFGKHVGKDLSEVPAGYISWMTQNFDPVPLPKDTRGMTIEAIKEMEERMRSFLSLAEDELLSREET